MSPRACHEFSNFVRWLSYVDIAWLVGLVNNSSSGIPEEHGSPLSCLSTCPLDTDTGWESIPLRSSLAPVSLSLDTVVVGEVDELEEDVGWSISCLESVMDVEEGKREEELVDKPEPWKQLVLPVVDGVNLLVEEVHDKFSHMFFGAIFGEDSTALWRDCVDVQRLLALVVGGNPSDSPRKSSWTSPRPGSADTLSRWMFTKPDLLQ